VERPQAASDGREAVSRIVAQVSCGRSHDHQITGSLFRAAFERDGGEITCDHPILLRASVSSW
jgi:hypothetical protein